MRVAFGSLAANRSGRQFLGRLAEELAAREDRRTILLKTRDAANQLFHARRRKLPDRQARLIVGLCSLVLAAYREVHAATGNSVFAAEVVRQAYLRTNQAATRGITQVLLRLVPNPVPILARLPLAWFARRMYGSVMSFQQERSANGIDLIVSQCAFHRFFVEHGEPTLTRVFCGWDRNWMDEVAASARPIRVERPSTLSTGGPCCRFRFVQAAGPAANPMVDILVPATADEHEG